MSQEQDPVASTEYVLRRIHKSHFKDTLRTPILRLAFQPGKADSDGLSVYRELFVSAAEVAGMGRTPGAYYVARLAVAAIQALNLSVIADPQSGFPGHALIPELNLPAYQQDKPRLDPLQVELARLASLDIVHSPPS